MPSRLQTPRIRPVPNREPLTPTRQSIKQEPTYTDNSVLNANSKLKPAHTSNNVNTMSTHSPTLESKHSSYANSGFSPNSKNKSKSKIPSTIRTVPSFEAPSDISSESPSARNSGFSSSINSNVSGTSYNSQQAQSSSTVRLKSQSPGLEPPLPISRSEDPYMSASAATLGEEMVEEPTLSLQVPGTPMPEDHTGGAPESSPQWDGAVGKAGLGKTGRVINKLVSDNEALKRDIQIERFKAEEAKRAAKIIEDKMEHMVADYENRLLEATITKTLLSRKERQVEHLQSTVDLEKKRTADAQERERIWREEMEKSRRDTKVQVEEANMHAALMEGRYNAISSHWKDQGDEVKRAMAGLEDRIKTLVEERRTDDEKINVLRDLCDQQDGNIRDLQRQKDEIAQQFEAYKHEQEQALKDIKKIAHEREEEQERALEEAKRVLGQLKWALNVKKNVKGAE